MFFFYSDGFFFAVKEVSLLDHGSQGKQSIFQLQQVRRPNLLNSHHSLLHIIILDLIFTRRIFCSHPFRKYLS